MFFWVLASSVICLVAGFTFGVTVGAALSARKHQELRNEMNRLRDLNATPGNSIETEAPKLRIVN